MPSYYQILEPGDIIQRGDEFYNSDDEEWTREVILGRAWETGSYPTRRRIDTEGVDPVHAAGLWRSLHTLLHLFTDFVDEHSHDPEALNVTTLLPDGTRKEGTLFETFQRFAGILKGTNPDGWQKEG